MPEAKKPANLFQGIIQWFKDTAEWVQQNLGDPAIAASMREDLGLAPGADIPAAQKDKFGQFAEGLDPDKEAFQATVEELKDVITSLMDLGDALKKDQASGWDVAYLIAGVAAAETFRIRVPAVYAAGKLLNFISDDPQSVDQFDPAALVALLRGDAPALTHGEKVVQRLSASMSLLVIIVEQLVDRLLGPGMVDAFYGWDPAPDSPTRETDQVSMRALTLIVSTPGDVAARLSLTLLAVPAEHGGPGLHLSLGGALKAEHVVDTTKYTFDAGVTGALDLFMGKTFKAAGDPNGFLRIGSVRALPDQPALRFGEPGKTRLDIGKLVWGVELQSSRAGFRFALEEVELVINLGEGDGFMQQLPGGEVRAKLNFGLIVDTAGGLRIEGGTGLRASIPVNRSLFGAFTVHHIDVVLGPGRDGADLGLELSGAFSVKLGPFTASVDRLGFMTDVAFRKGNLGLVDLSLGFKPPNGIGLVLDAGIVKGGGYLFLDHARHEYAGVLELKFGVVGIKAIGLLATRMPDGSKGWSLLLLIFGQFPPIQLSWGFTLTGIGGMIGLQHSVNTDALISGMSSGVLDDILFPRDPVGDAPRIINRLRAVFPPTPAALVIGPMLELGWGTPNLETIRLGVLIQLDNALGGDRPVSFGKVVILGQVLVQIPPLVKGELALVRLLTDFVGTLEFDPFRLGFVARLRDSRVGLVNVTGMFVIRAVFGDQPTFVLAAGGFHPDFKDAPPGLPAPIDRLGATMSLGPVKLTFKKYFAITPATVQVGAEVRLSAKLGPIELAGWLGFDAICYFEPRFYFEISISAGLEVKFEGISLVGIEVKMTLSGPGRWRMRGTGKFKILFFKKDIDFDESWGDDPELPAAVGKDVAALVREDLATADNWSANLPVGGEPLVTISPPEGSTGVLAHPLSRLQFTQKRVPFGLELERYGNEPIAGARRFDIDKIKIGDRETAPTSTSEFFALSQFVNLSDADKLSKPSFERLASGVTVGSDAYSVSAQVQPAEMDFETFYLEPDKPQRLFKATLMSTKLMSEALAWQATRGAAGLSSLRGQEALRPREDHKIQVSGAALALVDVEKLAGVGVELKGLATLSRSLAFQQRGAAPLAQVVEAFEVAVP